MRIASYGHSTDTGRKNDKATLGGGCMLLISILNLAPQNGLEPLTR